jgi:hypothetical protein
MALSGAVAAQDSTPVSSAHAMDKAGAMHEGQNDMDHMKGMSHSMKGMHAMPATVSAVDTKTGIVEVTAGGMALKVHFPPSAVADLKAGDKITLHLGFSKP